MGVGVYGSGGVLWEGGCFTGMGVMGTPSISGRGGGEEDRARGCHLAAEYNYWGGGGGGVVRMLLVIL